MVLCAGGTKTMSQRNFLRLQKKLYELSPASSLQAINQVLENFKELHPATDQNTLLWCTLYGFLKEHPSKELDFIIFAYMNEIEGAQQVAKGPKVA